MSTILLIEDSPSYRAEIRRVVENAQLFKEILEAEDGLRGLGLLTKAAPDVVLCDLEMPGLDGEKLLSCNPSGVPFLFLTASQDATRKVRLLENGACDFIAKPCDPAELVARLKLHLKLRLLQSELREKNLELEKQSRTDAVTGLRNRRYIDEFLAVECLRARRYGAPLSVLMADLDHFKQVNDRYGHPAGDAVLRGMAHLLEGTLRAADVGGRYGGEEFVVILPQTDLEGAAEFGERLRSAVDSTSFEISGEAPIHVTLSAGAAELDAKMARPEDLVAAADAALYEAKGAGRNRVALAARPASKPVEEEALRQPASRALRPKR
jgi:diguanylate cyclase (GGDEF)-like protein